MSCLQAHRATVPNRAAGRLCERSVPVRFMAGIPERKGQLKGIVTALTAAMALYPVQNHNSEKMGLCQNFTNMCRIVSKLALTDSLLNYIILGMEVGEKCGAYLRNIKKPHHRASAYYKLWEDERMAVFMKRTGQKAWRSP